MIPDRLRRAVPLLLALTLGSGAPAIARAPVADTGASTGQDTASSAMPGATGRAVQEEAAENSCVTCHSALGGQLSQPAERFPTDIHAERGFGCVDCHGGDGSVQGLEAMDPATGFIGVPPPRDVPELCGRCHSDPEFMKRFNPEIRVDQVEEYWTSVHGKRLSELGDTLVAVCSSCHGIHGIRPPSDPTSKVYPLNVPQTCGNCHADPDHMASYDIPTDQLENYRKSIHWERVSRERDLSAPTCNDCHGNHGATPPGVSWVGNVCGQCHTVMETYFKASFHSEIFDMLGSPGCVTCHGNHWIRPASDRMLGVQDDAVCGQCHTASDQGGEVAAMMRSLVDSLSGRIQLADSILTRAEDAGMEVSQPMANLHDARSALIRARTTIHTFTVDSLQPRVDDGLEIAGQTLQEGRDALKELQVRRVGLGVSSVLILILILALVLKIRETGSGRRRRKENP